MAGGRSFIAVALVVLLASLPAPPASAQAGPTGRISLASQTAWTGAGQPFELRVDLASVRQPESLELTTTVHEAVTSRSQFRQTLDGQLLGAVRWRSGPTPLPQLALDPAGTVPVTIGPPDLELDEAGVHPVRVELRRAGGGEVVDAFTTHLVRTRDDAAAPLAVAWVQGVAAPIALQPDGSVVLDDGDRDRLATTATAMAATEVPLTLVPRPETLDALATAAPEILDQLAAGLDGRQLLAGPYVEVPTTALVAAGLPGLVEAERALGSATVEQTLAPPDPGTWVSDGAVDPAVLARRPEVERLVVPEVVLSTLDRPLTLANPFLVEDAAGRRIEAAAVDPGLAAHFDGGDDPVLDAHHLLADLAVLAYDAPGQERGVVVAPPPGWTATADFLATALPALASGPVVQGVTLDGLFDQVPLATDASGDLLVRTLRPPPAPPRPVAGEELRRLRADLASLAAMVEASGAAAARLERLERLALVSAAAELTAEEQAAYRGGVDQGIGRMLGDVGILSEGSFQLTSREATVPLTLVNDLDADVEVTLALESDKLDFVVPVDEPAAAGSATLALTLAPGPTPVMVPVVARASGDFPLLISLQSPDGRLEVASTRLTIRSTFPSGVGFLLSAGAGLFLALWWARHWRTTRRDRRLVAPPA